MTRHDDRRHTLPRQHPAEPRPARGALVSACRLAPALLACACAAQAAPQWSGSLTLMSDHRLRGVSLSDGHPGLRAALDADVDGGWYAGTSLARAELWPDHRRTRWQLHAGRSMPLAAGWSGELGVTHVHFAGERSYDYGELYAGLLSERWQLRVQASPDYYGRGVRSGYVELNTSIGLPLDLRGLAHIGALAVSRTPGAYASRRTRADLLLGVSRSFDALELQLAWSAAQRGGPYPSTYGARRSGWVASASLRF